MENKMLEDLKDLMAKIDEAMKMSNDKKNDIEKKEEELYNEVRPMAVEKGKNELDEMRKEKKEFDEMTAEALKRAKKEIIKIEKENDERFSSDYLVFLKKKEEINRKLESIKSRFADRPKVVEDAEKYAKKAMDELIEKNETSKANHEEIKEEMNKFKIKIEEYSLELDCYEEVYKVALDDGEEPEVEVDDKEPEVEVDDKEPEVEVDDKEPEVEVDDKEPEAGVDDKEPEVEVDDKEPEVKPEIEVDPEAKAREEHARKTAIEVTKLIREAERIVREREEKEKKSPIEDDEKVRKEALILVRAVFEETMKKKQAEEKTEEIPDPKKEPVVTPDPKKEPVVTPDPKKEPEVIPDPKKEPVVIPDPKKEPEVIPDPKKEPGTTTDPKKEPGATTDPKKEPVVTPDPKKEPEEKPKLTEISYSSKTQQYIFGYSNGEYKAAEKIGFFARIKERYTLYKEFRNSGKLKRREALKKARILDVNVTKSLRDLGEEKDYKNYINNAFYGNETIDIYYNFGKKGDRSLKAYARRYQRFLDELEAEREDIRAERAERNAEPEEIKLSKEGKEALSEIDEVAERLTAENEAMLRPKKYPEVINSLKDWKAEVDEREAVRKANNSSTATEKDKAEK